MNDNRFGATMWHLWDRGVFDALAHMRPLEFHGVRAMEDEPRGTAWNLMQATGCYHVVSSSSWPHDDWQRWYLQRVEYTINKHVAHLHQLGYAVWWATDPNARTITFGFAPKRTKRVHNRRKASRSVTSGSLPPD
jgi:hypothetical protein